MKDNYGIWNFVKRKFVDDLSYNYYDVIGQAFYYLEDEDFGNNLAIVTKDNNDRPIWHEMLWCGRWQGYTWLFNECLSLGIIFQIDENDTEEDNFLYI
jgi:hypothetical protein